MNISIDIFLVGGEASYLYDWREKIEGLNSIPLLILEDNKTNIIGVVPKWFKGAVCKTVIHRFESGRRLHL